MKLVQILLKVSVRFLLSVLVLLKDKDRWDIIKSTFHGYMLILSKTPKDKSSESATTSKEFSI
jgi:hypothetical protein